MKVRAWVDAEPYEAPNHRGVLSLRLQGFQPDEAQNQWVGYSHVLPGGGAGPDASPLEKVYVVLDGELTVIVDGRDHVLRRGDSCTIPAGEVREMANRSNDMCALLVVMPYPAG